MKLCNLESGAGPTLGVVTESGIVDVVAAGRSLGVEVPRTTDALLRGEHAGAVREVVERASGSGRYLVAEAGARYAPCVLQPEKILMMGWNYRRHCRETKIPIPTSPTFFSKFNNALLGDGGVVPLPVKVASRFDYEAELVVVVGKVARDVAEADALSYVFGYCNGNDLTARDLQFKTSQYLIGKSCDGFAPIGPWLVTSDEVPDPQRLSIECRVNGELRQSSSTADMIFGCAALLSYASQHMTLRPGDLIFTGTPEGVIQGRPEGERVWLEPGDRLTTRLEGLGELHFSMG